VGATTIHHDLPGQLSRLGPDNVRALIAGLWNHFPENMFVVRVEGHRKFIVDAINPAQEAFLQMSADKCVGQYIDELIPAPGCHDVVTRYQECVDTGHPIRYEEKGFYITPDGAPREGYWLTLIVPIKNDSGQTAFIFGISQNITDIYTARDVLERQNLDLERRVAERTRELEDANRQLQILASRDPLTQTCNRRMLGELASQEFQRAVRYRHPLSIIMLDIDEFKEFNEHHGHAFGDQVLQAVVAAVRSQLRETDHLGRYGGDEFVILLPETNVQDANEAAERIRNTVADSTQCSISLGLTSLRPGDTSVEQVMERADSGLRSAKRDGRNRTNTAIA